MKSPGPRSRRRGAGARLARAPRLLLLAKTFRMPYRVLRCAHGAGAQVHLLCAHEARGLRHSRFHAGFSTSGQPIDGMFDPALADEINAEADRLDIDMVLAGDAPSTRALIAIKDLIRRPCFPMPGLSQFDLLNDKWRFTQLCESLGLQFPRSALFQTPEELNRYVSTNTFEGPHIAKPLSKDGGVGCVKFAPEDGPAKLSGIAYQPIIVQEVIEGEDICASVFCQRGEIKASLAYLYERATYVTFYDESILYNIGKIIKHMNVDGVINFDMRRQPDGRIIYVECNPRFFFKIAMSMVAGMNFVAMGLPGHEFGDGLVCCADSSTRFAKAWPLTPPWRLRARDWQAFRFLASDPIPLVWEQLGLADVG